MIQTIKKHTALDYIADYLPENPVIIEAGAFNGKDTERIIEKWPKATIHAFEPVPYLFEQLKKNVAHLQNVHCYPIALSDTVGTATFYISEKPTKPGIPSQAGSLLKPKKRLEWSPLEYKKTIEVPTTTLDAWAQEYNIGDIDFIWLDVQGFALDILKASPKTLDTLKVLYVEVEFIEAYEGQYQYPDVKEWLENNGFKMIIKTFTEQKSWFFGDVIFVKK